MDGYFAFLEQRDAGEIVRRFGIAVESPVDRFNQPRHRGDFGVRIPPSRRAMREFFTSWRDDLDNARKYPIAVQDHVMAKIAYLFAEGRELLWWYIEEIRAEFTDDPDDPQAPLWPSERLPSAVAALNIAPVACPVGPDTFRRALAAAATQHLSGPVHRLHPHLLRHACATHNYESGMPLWDVQQLLGARLGVHHGRVSLDRPRRSRAAQSRIVRPRCPPIDHRRIRP
ncbi:MAG TPA: tyrosine-type recombinase/integrase [Amycolatopsis sp.]|uniref:tyrosine-type recombinase/integrase n=1 Tax=Amycolatopsis sp. TaxID=37632 RepID=UPI002B4863CD|nr:tyrosine-type recombinase/integrase [Amycolatopsis sp.]HKS47037.1 tyrosine-type recombinase/integrase [Amycolatopsis sp.]